MSRLSYPHLPCATPLCYLHFCTDILFLHSAVYILFTKRVKYSSEWMNKVVYTMMGQKWRFVAAVQVIFSFSQATLIGVFVRGPPQHFSFIWEPEGQIQELKGTLMARKNQSVAPPDKEAQIRPWRQLGRRQLAAEESRQSSVPSRSSQPGYKSINSLNLICQLSVTLRHTANRHQPPPFTLTHTHTQHVDLQLTAESPFISRSSAFQILLSQRFTSLSSLFCNF